MNIYRNKCGWVGTTLTHRNIHAKSLKQFLEIAFKDAESLRQPLLKRTLPAIAVLAVDQKEVIL